MAATVLAPDVRVREATAAFGFGVPILPADTPDMVMAARVTVTGLMIDPFTTIVMISESERYEFAASATVTMTTAFVGCVGVQVKVPSSEIDAACIVFFEFN